MGLLLMLASAMTVAIQDGVRAFVSGEALWSKNQKDAVIALEQYLQFGDPVILDRFNAHADVQQHNMHARIELNKSWPDFDLVEKYLIAGGNDPDDVESMAYLFYAARGVAPFRRANAIWSDGDRQFSKVVQLAREIEGRYESRDFSLAEKAKYWSEIRESNKKLTELELSFSGVMAHVARIMRYLLLGLNLFGFFLVFSILVFLFYRLQGSQNQILQERRRFDLLVKGLNDALIFEVADQNGNIIYVNDQFCKITGFSRKELHRKSHRILNSGFHTKEFFQNMWNTISNGNSWTGEIRNRTKKGELIWVDTLIMPVMGENGEKQYISIRRDVTEIKRNQELSFQSAKMATLGEMASGVAHEINNPLAVIQGKVLKLIKLLMEPEVNRESLLVESNKIISNVERISSIIKGLHSFSRNTEGDEPTECSVKSIVDDTLSLCRERFKNNGIELRIGEIADANMNCSKVHIQQILLNLLNNSFDAVQDLKEKWVSIEVKMPASDRIHFVVTDSGLGIPEAVANKILEPFFTTKPTGKGTGLGLSISKGIAEKHNGALLLDRDAQNTKFVLDLPIQNGAG